MVNEKRRLENVLEEIPASVEFRNEISDAFALSDILADCCETDWNVIDDPDARIIGHSQNLL